jgi:hypothetical protein
LKERPGSFSTRKTRSPASICGANSAAPAGRRAARRRDARPPRCAVDAAAVEADARRGRRIAAGWPKWRESLQTFTKY